MKILIISKHFGEVTRGAETWAENLAKNINYDVRIVKSIFALKDFLDADIVIPTNGRLQVFIARILSFLLGKPMVVFGHSGPGADDKWNLLCLPNVFVSFSKAQKKWADKYKLPFTKSICIHHAVDTKIFTPPKNKPKKKTVLCVAANTPDKRVDLVRKAVSNLDGYKFVAVGKGSDKEIAFSDMPEVYRNADVFCFVPKSHEAFGLVFLEAMACNLPVVTIDDDVRREIVGNAGLFVKNPEDTNSLSKAIKNAYETNWGDKPRKQAEKFSWSKIRKDYTEFFSSIK